MSACLAAFNPPVLFRLQTLNPDVLSEIEKDTHRTFPGHKM